VDDVVGLRDLLLENLDFLRHVLAATAVGCRAAVSTAFRNAPVSGPAERRFHYQVLFRIAPVRHDSLSLDA